MVSELRIHEALRMRGRVPESHQSNSRALQTSVADDSKPVTVLWKNAQLVEECACIDHCDKALSAEAFDNSGLQWQRVAVGHADPVESSQVGHHSCLSFAVYRPPYHEDRGSKGSRILNPFQATLTVQLIESLVQKLTILDAEWVRPLGNLAFIPVFNEGDLQELLLWHLDDPSVSPEAREIPASLK